ncbi:hypothetical protein [Bdellovibrio sp. HCB337]|uniref:hypothetical protein n=1 Tax=Bdellovibrio sp. HCB337 TaxID=3394358 RepID=UPI0039A61C5E
MNYKIPVIQNFFTAPAYLTSFFEMNKSETSGFSHRVFAAAIDWPVSYLHDVISGRKKFTVLRAVQLAHFLKLNSIATERLIYFSLNEENDPSVREYSQKRIVGTAFDEKRTSQADYEFFKNVDVEAVFSVIVWAKKRIASSKIKSLLYTFPELTEARIESVIEWLTQKSFLVFDGKGVLVSSAQDLVLDEHGADPNSTGVAIHEKYAESFGNFTRNPKTPCMYNGGFFEIPRKDFLPVAQRILETRNWLAEYVKTANANPKEKIQDTLVFQMDMNLFTIFDKTVAQEIGDDLETNPGSEASV